MQRKEKQFSVRYQINTTPICACWNMPVTPFSKWYSGLQKNYSQYGRRHKMYICAWSAIYSFLENQLVLGEYEYRYMMDQQRVYLSRWVLFVLGPINGCCNITWHCRHWQIMSFTGGRFLLRIIIVAMQHTSVITLPIYGDFEFLYGAWVALWPDSMDMKRNW